MICESHYDCAECNASEREAVAAVRAEAEAEMRALMACGHPKACLTMGPVLHFDKIDVLNVEKSTQCFVCAEIAALKAKVTELEGIDQVCDFAHQQVLLLQADLDKLRRDCDKSDGCNDMNPEKPWNFDMPTSKPPQASRGKKGGAA